MQLSEMEEEMDQRIHAAERKARDQVGPTQTRRHKHIRLHTTQKDDFLILNVPGSFFVLLEFV